MLSFNPFTPRHPLEQEQSRIRCLDLVFLEVDEILSWLGVL